MQDRPECLSYCLCYKKKAGFCLDRVSYNEKKVLLRLFLNLQEQGSVNVYITVEDVMEWFFRHERKMLKDWFPELKESCDDETWLAWQVNAHLRMQDIEQEVRRELIVRHLSSVSREGNELQDCEQHVPSAPSDLESPEKRPDDLKIHLLRRILSDLEIELQYYQCSRLHTRLEVVADLVTRLIYTMKTDPSGTPYHGSSMQLTELSVDIARAVLRRLSSTLPMSNLQAHYSRPAAARMTHSIHHKLVKAMYTADAMKKFLCTGDETLMATVIDFVSVKVTRLFQMSFQRPSQPPSILRLFMIASNYKSSPTTAQKLVIHIEAVTSVLTLVLLQMYSQEDTGFTFEAHNWPLIEHVVNRLSHSGVKVTKKKAKVNCYFNMNEVVCMVNSICKDVFRMYGSMKSLMEALSNKNRMVSRDIGRLVSVQLEMVCRNRKMETLPFELPPCPDLEKVICGVVARFVHALVPVTMADKDDLIICLLLVDQIRFLTKVTLFQSQEANYLSCHLKDLSSDTIEQLGDMVYNQYAESFPLYDVQDQLHTLVMDKHQSYMISTMITTTLQDYVTLLDNISCEEHKEAPTSSAPQPPPGFTLPDAPPVVKPPPGFTLPDASPVVKAPPGFTLPDASPVVKPPPGFTVPPATSAAVRPPPGFHLPDASPVVKPSPGFTVPPATSAAVRPPPGFHLPATSPAVKPPPGFTVPPATSAAVRPPPGFDLPATSPVVKPPPRFDQPAISPAVKPPPGFDLPASSAVVKPPPGFTVPPPTSAAVKPPPGFLLPDASPAVKPPHGFTLPDASPAVKPPPGFPLPVTSPAVRPPPGFALPNPSPAVKPLPGFTITDTLPAVKPPPGFALPNASAAVRAVKPPSELLVADVSPAAQPPSGFLLSECTRPELCPEVPDWEMEDEAQDIEKNHHVCAQDKAMTVTSNDSKDVQNHAALPSERVKSTKKKGLKAFLQKIRKALRFRASSSDSEGGALRLSRSH
ncbi:uncharacterized protein LOC125297018 [Alosa alosa]|uniref:uncharacterized protein LOC125297018 n=1 Tax=Alosa alosa TaxID=278164 RepID=UPI00201547E6|nr:uncharacterized protein LOC125297018 [Alosa alosa]